MKLFYSIFMALIITLMPACKSVPSEKNQVKSEIIDQLPPQQLKPGECALFLWTAGQAQKLVFFQKQGDKLAKFMDSGGQIKLQSSAKSQFFQLGAPFNINYISADYASINLSGNFTETMQDGERVRASLKFVKQDGWEKIIPLIGIYACE